jgi:hypothetical protein
MSTHQAAAHAEKRPSAATYHHYHNRNSRPRQYTESKKALQWSFPDGVRDESCIE